jgi:hypothetical protein
MPNGNFLSLASESQIHPGPGGPTDTFIGNRIVEMDYETSEVVW